MTTKSNLMGCGCAPNASYRGKPFCAIHMRADTIPVPDLTGREARCSDCNAHRPSKPDLAFFQYRPDMECDAFYCGCCGWD